MPSMPNFPTVPKIRKSRRSPETSNPELIPGLPEGPFRRRSARILLVNDEDRLLLFRYRNEQDESLSHYWITPGGGVDKGEELAEAAARELFEETGLRVTPEQLGEPVAATGGYADLGWAKGVFRDTFFFHRVAAHDVDMSGFTDYEVRTFAEQRWWSAEEIAASEEHIVPFELAPLLDDLMAGNLPEKLVVLPWHH